MQKRSVRQLQLLILLSAVALVFGLIFVFAKQYFSVRTIEISASQKIETVRGVSGLYNSFLPLASEDKIGKLIIAQNPLVSKVGVRKVYPDRLKLTVTLLKPSVVIKVDAGYFVLASNGRVLAKVKEKPKTVPEVTYYQKLIGDQIELGDSVGFIDILTAITFVNLANSLGERVQEVDIKGFYMIRLLLDGSRELLVTTEKDRAKQAYQIGAIIRQFKIQGKEFKTIDVRFDKPVVTFQ